jgi:ABC-type glutathione transport system ATPase component
MKKQGQRQSTIKKSDRKSIQLSWENIVIKTVPLKKRCSKEFIGEAKTILNDVSGSVLPGQFLSIIGASGIFIA